MSSADDDPLYDMLYKVFNDDVDFEYGNNVKKEKPQGGNIGVGNDPVMNKINNMAELYANILKVVHNQE